jgi:hypothetical protein
MRAWSAGPPLERREQADLLRLRARAGVLSAPRRLAVRPALAAAPG